MRVVHLKNLLVVEHHDGWTACANVLVKMVQFLHFASVDDIASYND